MLKGVVIYSLEFDGVAKLYRRISRLPESVGKLFNLETLRLCHCNRLEELPKSTGNLINLQYLDISDTRELKEMPLQIGNLTSLKMLGKFIVGEGNNGLRISEVGKFSELEGKLHIAGLQNVEDIRDMNFINLKEKRKLFELELEWTGNTYYRNGDVEVQVLNSLEPHPDLSRLSIAYFGGTEFSSRMRNPIFTNMVDLKLKYLWNIGSLPPLGRLPSLKHLTIEGMHGLEEVGSEFYENDSSFSSLETLCIRDMKGWKHWCWHNDLREDTVAKFPKLHRFDISYCPQLLGILPSFLPSVERLQIENCPQLIESPKVLSSLVQLYIIGGYYDGCQEAVLRNLCTVPRLTKLEITNISGLVRLDESYMQALVALQGFRISRCDELKYLWADGTNLECLTSLKSLSIFGCAQLLPLVDGKEGFLPCNLENLSVTYCGSLKELPSGLHNLKSLKHLRVDYCAQLLSLVDGEEGFLPCNLENLSVRNCGSLKELPSGLHNLKYLKHLRVEDCENLVFCSKEMSHLEKLEVIDCKSITCSPTSKFPDSLQKLSFCRGTKQYFDSFYYGFSHLTCLELRRCNRLEMFPDRELHIPTLIDLTVKIQHQLMEVQLSNS